jgi:transitional endoplasmic reticulum ATPase
MSKYYGQSEANLRKKFEEAEKNAPSIIFIDEIDAIASKREDTHGEVEKRVVAQLLAIMDGLNARGRVVVVAATNLPNMLDPALRRPGRFDREIEISIPNLESREDILKIHTRSMPLHENVNLKKLAEVTHGFVGADLSALAKEAAMIVLRRLLPELENVNEGETLPQETLDKIRIAHEDFVEALKTVRPSAMREVFIEIPNVKWDDIGGVEESKERLKEVVEWPLKYPENFKKLGINPPKGVLLFGPPGTGKTLLAKAVANESQANFISIKGPEILNKWVGETEKAIRNIFEKARQTSPCVVFIDEIDSITPRRSASADSKVTEKIVNSILTEMDGVQELHNVMVIGATNRPDIVDPALLRPGRFDRLLFIDAPKEKGVEEILKIHTKNMPLDKDVNISELSKKLKGYTGADIAGLCREAVMHALRENVDCKKITENDFLEAIKEIRPSVTKEAIEAYKKIADKLKTAKADQVSDDQPNYYG